MVYIAILLVFGMVIWCGRKESVAQAVPKGMTLFYRCAAWLQRKIKLLKGLELRIAAWALLFLLLGDVGALAAYVAEQGQGEQSLSVLEREAYDQPREEILEVQDDSHTSYTITLPVPGRIYSEAKIDQMFQEALQKMEQFILGGNESLEHIDEDMTLLTQIPQTPIRINWTSSQPEILNWQGEIQEAVPEKGSVVQLDAQLAYEDQVESYSCQVKVYPQVLSKEKAQEKAILEAAAIANEDPTASKYRLPAQVDGKAIKWYAKAGTSTSLYIAGGGVFAAIMLVLYQEQERRKAQTFRNEMLIKDYPQILSKCTLLLGAGMSMRKAIGKIAMDYQQQKKTQGVMEYGYEEVLNTYYEMEKGITEQEAYERLGARAGLSQYKAFSMLLVQNLRKGNGSLTEILERESMAAFEERKRHAKILGEKAGTKLLLPMGAMLVIVFIIIIVPAFLSF